MLASQNYMVHGWCLNAHCNCANDFCDIHFEKKHKRENGKWYCSECEKERNQARG